ncbi:hypothetical protein NW762_001513 [Fusarium torreyae]|uniref:G domain-containing protein n=1 Tax=Fusarium torreyae TaxID=1237075 RepID=A0A9W8SDF2_9HYPO|nr:hypothetical protein NW762_001513 [Fusarium torreyae]
MDDPSLGADALVDQAESVRAFLGLTQPQPTDRFFLVTGMTGSGKSTFVSMCTGQDAHISHGLCSCTKTINVFPYADGRQRIYLVDTPGFNDTTRSDVDTLKILATYLGASYANGVRIHGIIMLYPISNNRMSGSSLRSLALLKSICGFTSYHNLGIVTTMWPQSPDSAEKASLSDREAELMTTQDFFGNLISQGARLFRHYEEGHRNVASQAASAQRIVRYLNRQLDSHVPSVLQLQREIVDEKKTLGQTVAGIAAANYLHQARQEHQQRLKDLRAEMTNALVESDKEYAFQLRELKIELKNKLHKTEIDSQALTKTMAHFHEAETEALQQRIVHLSQKFEAEVKTKEQELQELRYSYNKLQQEVARLSQQPQQQQTVTRRTIRHGQAIKSALRKAHKAREEQRKFQTYAGDVVNGLTNGLTAGAASGGIAALE